jgi:DnaJ-domain-containing protein 1
MSLFDRLGGVVKAEWNARFGEADDELPAADEARRRPAKERPTTAATEVPGRPSRAAVSDVESAYRVLELKSGASLDEVRFSYQQLARRYHPRTLSKIPDQAYAAQTVLDALTEALELLEGQLLPLPSRQR